MPIKKFRSIEDMKRISSPPLDPNNLRKAFELARLCVGLAGGKRLRPGVYKYRSITEANEARARNEEPATR